MKPLRRPAANLWAAAFIALAAAMVLPGPAQAEPSWTRLRASDFPSYVKAIEFPGGNVINSSGELCWGKWCVNIGPNKPSAVFNRFRRAGRLSGDSLIYIKGLACKNPVAGSVECRMSLLFRQGTTTCRVHPPEQWAPPVGFYIKCPESLRLE